MNGSIQDAILAHPFFAGLRIKDLCILTESASRAAFAPDEFLFREGEPANRCYLIQKGLIALEARDPPENPVLIQTLTPGDVLGWSWLFPPFEWHFSARAVESVKTIVLDAGHLVAAADNDHDFGYELMKRVSRLVIERLQGTRNRFLAKQRESQPAPDRPHPDSIKSLLETHPFLFGLSADHVNFLTSCATIRRFASQQELFHEGEDADHFYLILSGEVTLETVVPGTAVATIQNVGAGQALGWSWLYPPYRWHFTARTIEPTEVISFEAASLRNKSEEDRDFRDELLSRVSKLVLNRLESTRMQLIDLYATRL